MTFYQTSFPLWTSFLLQCLDAMAVIYIYIKGNCYIYIQRALYSNASRNLSYRKKKRNIAAPGSTSYQVQFRSQLTVLTYEYGEGEGVYIQEESRQTILLHKSP